MDWVNAEKEKPTHGDIVIVAMWRPEEYDYMHFIAIWDIHKKIWLEHGGGENLEKTCGYDILWWSDIDEPECPDQCLTRKQTPAIGV